VRQHVQAAPVLNSWITLNYQHVHGYHSNVTDYSTQYRVALLLDRVGNIKLAATKHGRVALSGSDEQPTSPRNLYRDADFGETVMAYRITQAESTCG
jgi:hypothetical protein